MGLFMLQKITTKTKLIVPIVVLSFVLLFLGGLVISNSYTKMLSLETLNDKITLSKYLSQTLHSLQKERGLSSGYLENQGKLFQKEMLLQRKESDFQLQRLMNQNILQDNLLFEIGKISAIRAKIDAKILSTKDILDYYSNINTFLLKIIIDISKSSHIPKITQNILAYVHFLYLKEYGGIERAKGVVLFARKQLSHKELVSFIKIVSVQQQSEAMFLNYACKNVEKHYIAELKYTSFQKVKEIEKQIIDGELRNIGLSSEEWYQLITTKLNRLDDLGRYIENHTIFLINKELKDVKLVYNAVIFLTLFSLIVFLIMLKAFVKLANEERKLRMVAQKYIISSVTDLKGRILDVSDAFCDISGYEREELIGQKHNIVRHPDMPKSAFEEMWKTIKEGKAWKGKVKNLRKDGSSYWVWANIEPLYNSKGKIDSYISIRLDITESELLQEKVKEQREKNRVAKEMMYQQSRLAQMGEMLSMIAHQWRQPLSAITAASGAINLKSKLKKLDEETAIELSSKIMDFSQHLSTTIDDFRGFFKTNKIKVKTDLKKIVDDVSSIVKTSLDNDGISLEINVNSYGELLTFESELKQVLLNLIKNAQDALNEKQVSNPKIVVEVADTSVSVRDNAGGISEEIMDKIFDPYFSTKTKKDGTGLGLYMSKTIVEDHCNGKLEVTNTQEGAEFKINL
jgi:PAS domain S-box-containing protein